MFPSRNTGRFFKKVLLHSLKLPVAYFIIGTLFITLSYIDDVIIPLTQFKKFFDIADKIGNILLILGIITFIYNFIVALCRNIEKKLIDNHKIASLMLSSLRKGFRVIFILVALNYIIPLLGPTPFYLTLANNIINTVIIGAIGWVAIQVLYTIEAMIYHYMLTLPHKEHLRVKALYTKVHILKNIAAVVIIIITMAVILMSFSSVRNIGISLLASAGFITAIAGLAAQKTLFTLFSGLQIALSQPIKIGDMIQIEKESGIIEEITFTYVTLKLSDRKRMVVPIQYFIERHFENWSKEYDGLRSSLLFYVDYMMPVEPLRAELDHILANSAYWDGKAKKLQVSKLLENSVEMRIQVSASNADNLSDLRAEVREKILKFMRENYPNCCPKLRCRSEANEAPSHT